MFDVAIYMRALLAFALPCSCPSCLSIANDTRASGVSCLVSAAPNVHCLGPALDLCVAVSYQWEHVIRGALWVAGDGYSCVNVR